MARCLRCEKVSRTSPGLCWEKWQLCGDCALLLHPEDYPKKSIAFGRLLQAEVLNTISKSIEPVKY